MEETKAEKKERLRIEQAERRAYLRGEAMLGYGCVSSTVIRKKDKEEYAKSLEATKAYELISHMMNPDNILIDVITGSYRKRPQLMEIMDAFVSNSDYRRFPSGTIVVPSIADLGTTVAEFMENYMMLCENDIGILILDNEKLSTADYGCQYCKTREEIAAALDTLTDHDFQTRQGRKKKQLEITDGFVEVYWYNENYFCPESIVYKNNIIGKVTKVAFYQLCDLYEKSERYAADELEQDRKHNISQKPKRYGKTKEEIPILWEQVERGEITLEEASSQMGMTPITFKRFVVKGNDRKTMGKATFAYKDQAIIDKLIGQPEE